MFGNDLLFCSIFVYLLFCCNDWNTRIQKWIVRISFFVIFLLLYLQMQNVYLYFDDFGYRSLSYRGLLGKEIDEIDLKSIFLFLKNHYMYWGGRILFFFFEIVLIQNIFFIRLAEAAVLTGIFYLSYQLVSKKLGNKVFGAVIPFVYYMMMEKDILADGAYWFTASILYVFPIFFVLLCLLMYQDICFPEQKVIIKKINKIKKFLLILCIFVASFSQEQISSAVVTMFFLVSFEYFLKYKKISKIQILANLAALCGFLLLLFCPGNSVRMDVVGNKVSVINNVGSILIILGADSQKYISSIFLICAVVVAILLGKASIRRINKYFNYFLASVYTGIVLFMLVYNVGIISAIQICLNYCHLQHQKVVAYIILLCLFMCIFGQVSFWYAKKRKDMIYLYLILGAIVTLIVACVSPGIAMRALLPYYFFLIVVMTDIVVYLFSLVSKRSILYKIIICISGLVTGIAVKNYEYISFGYYNNAAVEKENVQRLENYQDYIYDEYYITLYRHADDFFGNIMPYMEGYWWVEEYMKINYKIPDNYIFQWRSYEDYLVYTSSK